jgi:hypothetical protein
MVMRASVDRKACQALRKDYRGGTHREYWGEFLLDHGRATVSGTSQPTRTTITGPSACAKQT